MKNFLNLFIMLAFILSNYQSAIANNEEDIIINDSTPYVTVTTKKTVMDTIATLHVIREHLNHLMVQKDNLIKKKDSIIKVQAATNARIQTITSRNSEYNNLVKVISNFIQEKPNTKIKDKEQKQILISLFDSIMIEERENQICLESKASQQISIKPTLIDSLYTSLNIKNKNINSVLKDVKKGKMSPEVFAYLLAIGGTYNDLINKYSSEATRNRDCVRKLDYEKRETENDINKLLKKINLNSNSKDYRSVFFELTNTYNYPEKVIEVTECVENKYYRPIDKNNDKVDYLHHINGWEWAVDDEHLLKETTYFPNNITYKYHPDHPEYRIVNTCVFDEKGNLIRVLYYKEASHLFNSLERDFIDECITSDYKNNKYDILRKPQEVQYVLKNILGLSNEHNKKINNINNSAINTISNSYGKSKSATNKAAQNVFGLLISSISENDRMKNAEANNFIKQCKIDHEGEFGRIWKVDRLDNKSFQIMIYCPSKNIVRNYKVEFSVSEPFGKLNLKHSLLPDTPMNK